MPRAVGPVGFADGASAFEWLRLVVTTSHIWVIRVVTLVIGVLAERQPQFYTDSEYLQFKTVSWKQLVGNLWDRASIESHPTFVQARKA